MSHESETLTGSENTVYLPGSTSKTLPLWPAVHPRSSPPIEPQSPVVYVDKTELNGAGIDSTSESSSRASSGNRLVILGPNCVQRTVIDLSSSPSTTSDVCCQDVLLPKNHQTDPFIFNSTTTSARPDSTTQGEAERGLVHWHDASSSRGPQDDHGGAPFVSDQKPSQATTSRSDLPCLIDRTSHGTVGTFVRPEPDLFQGVSQGHWPRPSSDQVNTINAEALSVVSTTRFDRMDLGGGLGSHHDTGEERSLEQTDREPSCQVCGRPKDLQELHTLIPCQHTSCTSCVSAMITAVMVSRPVSRCGRCFGLVGSLVNVNDTSTYTGPSAGALSTSYT